MLNLRKRSVALLNLRVKGPECGSFWGVLSPFTHMSIREIRPQCIFFCTPLCENCRQVLCLIFFFPKKEQNFL